jgi:membrane protein YdbS with pleckstrin-like domain
MYYDRYYYDWSINTLTIRKGIIRRKQIYLPFEKVQNVFKDQDLLDRIFGLYDVHLSTVGNGSIDMCHIDGLTKENSDKMVIVLLRQIKENIN